MTSTEGTVRDASATGTGRKAECGYDMGNGAKCALWKGHDKLPKDDPNYSAKHNSLELTSDDLSAEFMADDEVAEFVSAPAVRSAEQLTIDRALDRNYQEWIKRGGEAPVWSKFQVDTAKARKVRLMLRNAADNHEPPIQVRISDTFRPGGKVLIAFAGMKRRKYEKKDATQ